MNAQFMYDLREKYEFCSGTDLSEFFDQEVGDPSPKGKAKINNVSALNFVTQCVCAIEKNNGGDDLGTRAAIAAFLKKEK